MIFQIIRRLFVLEPGAERFSNLQKIFTSANLGRAVGPAQYRILIHILEVYRKSLNLLFYSNIVIFSFEKIKIILICSCTERLI